MKNSNNLSLFAIAALIGGIVGHAIITAISDRLSQRNVAASDEELEATRVLDAVDSAVRDIEGSWPLWKTGSGPN